VDAQEDVRKSIAEELHGSVQTRLVLLNFKIADVQDIVDEFPEEAKAELSKISEDLDDLRENHIRMISHRLHPSVIRLSLASALEGLCQQFDQTIPVELNIADEVLRLEPHTGSKIPDKTRLGLYRVAEEALGNVVKHAEATRAIVRLWEQKGSGMICISIEDDGQGIQQSEEQKRSLGMVTIQDYMGAIGGTYDIRSAPMEGTKVTVMAPLLPNESNEMLQHEDAI
jgi:two-component system sensor histidine kinase UhpB